MNKSRVLVSRSSYNRICDDLETALNYYEFNLTGKKNVVIKINLSDFRTPETGSITHPLFLDALLKYLRMNFDLQNIFVVESDSVLGLPDYFIEWFGFLPVLEKWNADYVNLSKCKTVSRDLNGFHFKNIQIPTVINDKSFFISLSKLKTSNITKMTCSLKNQFGCLPLRWKNRYHPIINKVIADVNLAIKPDFSIVDGIIGMGGSQGPSFGMPVNSKLFVCGKDPVAVDSVCAKIIGLRPSSVGHIAKSAKNGVGSMKFEVIGADLKTINENFYLNRLEFSLMKIGSWLQNRALKKS